MLISGGPNKCISFFYAQVYAYACFPNQDKGFIYIYIQPHDVELGIHIFPVSETSDDKVSIPWQTKDHGSSNFWLLKTGSRWGGKIALIE